MASSDHGMLRLEGKVAIITGAASGIGEATARLFAAHGATVVIADVQDQLGEAVAASIGLQKASYKHCDVTDEKQMEETVDYTVVKYGRLDIMHSNAGVLGPIEGVMDMDLTQLDKTLAVHVRGTAAAIKHAACAMRASGTRGSIICTASVAARQGSLGPAAYTVSKHAVIGLMHAAVSELGAHGIRINCISPFGVATPLSCLVTGMTPEQVEDVCCEMGVLKGVVLRAGNVAQAALFLASDASEYISGHDLVIDGGVTVVTRHNVQAN
ncbi:Short-chain dehydrogenase/reductase SDR protein [Dioscorea alata]|uniref:Short-chain dehydrogenase/reductase SDR protein n=1 Tax=Dioscorea alata TaxID=55571 RepID=A0ACB7U4K2_DIOAL|nr:Short-chain dehydrogenase/reductase SDR protein [Dioscorea alata]